jgi:hypothetical protein
VPAGVGVIVGPDGQLGTVVSSERFKQAIKPMDKASEAILALKPVTSRYKHERPIDLEKGMPAYRNGNSSVTFFSRPSRHSACVFWKRPQSPGIESHSVSCVSVLNMEIRTRWRAEQDQEHENIKCSKINFWGGSFRCDRIFGTG